MELVKKNIHMDRVKCRAESQITLDDDVNISDNLPDALSLILDQAEVKIDEIKGSADHAEIKGVLLFSVMYLTEDGDGSLGTMKGKIPFDEQVYMDGVTSADSINVEWELEDVTSSLINSRKINLQALVSLSLTVEELYDEETAVEMYHEEPVEYRKKSMTLSEIAIQKKDIFRIKEELELPQNYPNVYQMLWESIRLGEIELKPMDEKISIQGEMLVFLLYEGEGEDRPVRYYETTIPFSGIVECHGCSDVMLQDIEFAISHKEVEVRPDLDGEERMIGIDLVIDLNIRLYEEVNVEILSDVYGVTSEVEAVSRTGMYKNILVCNSGKSKASDRLKVSPGSSRILQLCHSEGSVQIDSTEVIENGIMITGTVPVTIFYITSDDKMPYASIKGSIPFQYQLDAPGITQNCQFHVRGNVEHMSVSMIDSEEIDVKAVLNFRTMVFRMEQEEIITDLKVSELDPVKLADLPSIVGYIAKEGDTLWQIGKKYYVPVSAIRELNHMSSDDLQAGDKILIAK